MLYKDLLHHYNRRKLDRPVYIWKSKTKKEFSDHYMYLVGIVDDKYINTISGLYNKNEFTKLRIATFEDLKQYGK